MKHNPKEQRTLFPEECLLREIAKQPRLSIGIPKENALVETRLPLTPEGVAIVTEEGHSVYIQRGAGIPMQYSDFQYSEAGAFMVEDASEVFSADLVMKIAPPTLAELNMMHDRSAIMSMLQLTNLSTECLKLMMTKVKCNSIRIN
jgi:alanine dehydrogenase